MKESFKLLILIIISFCLISVIPKVIFTCIGYIISFGMCGVCVYILLQSLAYKFNWKWWNNKEVKNE